MSGQRKLTLFFLPKVESKNTNLEQNKDEGGAENNSKQNKNEDGIGEKQRNKSREHVQERGKRKHHELDEDSMKAKRDSYETKSRYRPFLNDWKDRYEWVMHDEMNDCMYCAVCRKFPNIADTNSALYIGCGSGGTYREDSLFWHNRSKKHKRCVDEKQKVERVPGTGPLEKAVKTMIKKLDVKTQDIMAALFNTAFYVAKENIAFSKFGSLCLLQNKNKLDLGNLYKNEDGCTNFISNISNTIADNLITKLKNTPYVCILADGATDSAVIEQETVFVRFVDQGKLITAFADIVQISHANADGVLEGIERGLKSVGFGIEDLKKKVIGCNFDGAAVMLGKKGGVAKKLEDKVGHPVVAIHCVAHNLELGVLDAVKSVKYMSKFQETIHQIYKFYYYSPKRKREMKEIAAILEETPIQQTGLQKTRWVASRYRAVDAVIQSLPTIVSHMENSSNGQGEEAAKVKGYLKEITSQRFVSMLYFMKDVLKQLSDLSKQFQDNRLILTDVVAKLEVCLLHLEELKHETGESYLEYKSSFSQETGVFLCGKCRSQSVTLSKSSSDSDSMLMAYLDKVIDYVSTRFKTLQEPPLSYMSVFDHRELPADRSQLLQYGKNEVKELVEMFGYQFSDEVKAHIVHEWTELKVCLVKQKDKHPLDVYESMMMGNYEGIHNILLLVQIMLTISPSTAQCERSFSAMKMIKTSHRSSLRQEMLSSLMRIHASGISFEEFNPEPAIIKWMSTTKKRDRMAVKRQTASCSTAEPGTSTTQPDSPILTCPSSDNSTPSHSDVE